MPIMDLTREMFDRRILENKEPALVDFRADWCGHCRTIAPAVEQIGRENPALLVAGVDVDACPELARTYGVGSIPTLIAFRDGRAAGRLTGPGSVDEIRALVRAHLL